MAQLFRRDAKVEALRRLPLFEGLSKAELVGLARAAEDLAAPAGEVILREGQLANEFFVIVDGEVEVTKEGRHLRTLGPGDFFGEIALFDRSRRTATCTAATLVRFFVLTRRGFHDMLDRSPRVERKVLRALARRVLSTSDDHALEGASS